MTVGIFFGILSGFAIPAESFFIGQITNTFVYYDSGLSINEAISVYNLNTNCSLSLVQSLLAANRSDRIFCDATQEGNVINSASAFACDPDQTLTEELTSQALLFLYLAVLVFVAELSLYMLWTITALRQSKRMRISFYRAILQHKIGWFETNDVSELGPIFLK